MRLSVKRRAPSLTLENLLSCISNPRLKCQSMMTAKMFFMVSVLNESMEMMLKCLRNLGVISFRPPPGGPMAATINWSTSVSVVVSFLKQIHKQSIEFNFSVVCLVIDNRWRRKMFKIASGTASVASRVVSLHSFEHFMTAINKGIFTLFRKTVCHLLDLHRQASGLSERGQWLFVVNINILQYSVFYRCTNFSPLNYNVTLYRKHKKIHESWLVKKGGNNDWNQTKLIWWRHLTLELTEGCQTSITDLSNQYPWSTHCRRTSIGGCAPYFSLAGILRSSTNTTVFFPIGGPYIPRLRLLDKSY